MEEVKNMTDLLAANNWQQRYEGISKFQAMCETYPQVVSSQIIKVSEFCLLFKHSLTKTLVAER